mgnify:CR=1 FL=1
MSKPMTQLRTCFIGDSITNGTGDGTMLGWPGHLCAAEVRAGHDLTYYDLGIRGDTSADLLPRWQAEVTARLPAVLNCAIVFNFGLNDATEQQDGIRVHLGDSIKNARAMLSAAKAMHPTLWVGPTPIDDARQPVTGATGARFDLRNERVKEYSAAYRELAVDLAVPYLDLFTPLVEDDAFMASVTSGDALHPTRKGYEIIAGRVVSWAGWQGLMKGK